MTLQNGAKIHFIGVAGSGMSGIAKIFAAKGYNVTGSDLKMSAIIEDLEKLQIKVVIGHRAENIAGADLVIRSSAIGEDNCEIGAAKAQNIPVIQRAEALAILLKEKRSIAVAGTHGKTTTTSMLAFALQEMKLDPSYVIGAPLRNFGEGSRLGLGGEFIIEADESDGSFIHYFPTGAIITNLELDHVDNYETIEELEQLFENFIETVSDFIVISSDDPLLSKLKIPPSLTVIKVGFRESGQEKLDLTIKNVKLESNSSKADLLWQGNFLATLNLNIPGRHNIHNGALAVAAGIHLGFNGASLAQALSHFQGAARRFEIKSTFSGITVVDDYGHHPTELDVTLRAARNYLEKGELKPGRLIAIFQPHRFSRTASFYEEFARALSQADLVYLLDIYGAGEEVIDGVSSRMIAENFLELERVKLLSKEEVLDEILAIARSGDLIITMGAGDINLMSEEISLGLLDKKN
ncbi:MAG: UDP-N-acetylmuramate--L-alanine ligase [Actinomycetota bacterium]|nr:UDP-N-acetylmuramate--L-alanine ligase [Actinomycetota bacterium]